VVLVDLEVAAGEQLEVEAAVERDSVSRWSRKPTRCDRGASATVEIERDAKRGLARRADDECGAEDAGSGSRRVAPGSGRSRPEGGP
jgi:hypothetical protein